MLTKAHKRKNHNNTTCMAKKLMPTSKKAIAVLNNRAEILKKIQINEDIHEGSVAYIKFHYGNEYYGIPYHYAKEVMHNMNITKIPGAPDFIAGVINRRGMLLTVIDLRRYLQIQTHPKDYSYIIVIENKKMSLGLLVDELDDSAIYVSKELDLPLHTGSNIKSESIVGLHEGKIAILNVEAILSALTK